MWVQSWMPDVSWLPLFDAHEKKRQREKRDTNFQHDRDNLEGWLSWKSDVWDTVSDVLLTELWEDSYEVVNFRSKLLTNQYRQDWEEFSSVNLVSVENHGFYNTAVIEISHRFPPKKYMAKWNKYNPASWKHDWERVSYPKTSPWRVDKKTYRIQYTPWKVGQKWYPIFCFWGKVRDGKRVDLNKNMIIPILNEIESLA